MEMMHRYEPENSSCSVASALASINAAGLTILRRQEGHIIVIGVDSKPYPLACVVDKCSIR